MQLDWRYLFNEARIDWRDKGRNCSRGHINISCPWCGDDPSEHLTIDEDSGLYFCLRNNGHKGGEPLRILEACGIPRVKAVALLEDARRDGPPSNTQAQKQQLVGKQIKKWEKFETVEKSADHLDYLWWRGFHDPIDCARTFDLRYAPDGLHAGRLLIPLYDGEGVSGWTGRALRSYVEPKYMSWCNNPYASLAGRVGWEGGTLIVVEGPFDALKLNYALTNTNIRAVALSGKALPAGKLLLIQQQKPLQILVALDRDASIAQSMRIMQELRTACLRSEVKRLRLTLWKDPGDIPVNMVETWIREFVQ